MRRALIAALAVLCLAVPCFPQELGPYLYAQGCRGTSWIDFNDINRRLTGRFSPAAFHAWLPACYLDHDRCVQVYEDRYGVGSWAKKGNGVGERFTENAKAFFALKGFRSAPTDLDREDAIIVTCGGRPAWDAIILPAVAAAQPSVPPPAPTPTPVPTPIPPPVTPPATPATPLYPLCDDLAPAGVSPGVRVTTYFRPGLASTATVTTSVCRERARP